MAFSIGVISDTHLRRVTKEFKDIFQEHLSDKDLIVHSGDIVSNEMVDFLGKRKFCGVHGNMDANEVKARLPEKRTIEIGSFKIGIIHGWGGVRDLEERIFPEFQQVDVIIYGHTHIAANHKKQGVLFFNPGAAMGFSRGDGNSIGILNIDKKINSQIIMLKGNA